VLDTNVKVAGMAYSNGPPGRVVHAWRSGALQVFLFPWILAECARALPRLRPFTEMTEAEIADLVKQLAFAADVVEPDVATLKTRVRHQTRLPVSFAVSNPMKSMTWRCG
jgi:predicted nucleic acid-binding protein